MNNYDKKKIITNWLGCKKLNVFATVTLKKAIYFTDQSNQFYLVSIKQENVKQVGWILRDRVSKAVFGKNAFKNKKTPPFLVFCETNCDNRPHLHIMAVKPDDMSDKEYENLFRKIARNLDWVYNQIDLKFIPIEDVSKVLSYSLKTGFDSFIPEASFIH